MNLTVNILISLESPLLKCDGQLVVNARRIRMYKEKQETFESVEGLTGLE